MSSDASRLLLARVAGALALRADTYRTVAADEAASLQAGLVVVIGGILEAAVRATVHGDAVLDSTSVLYSVAAALIGWTVWTAIVLVVGTRLFAGVLELRGLARAVGFAHSPGLAYGLAALPGVVSWAGLVLVSSLAWFVAALCAAVRGVMDVTLGRAIAVTAAALLAHEALHQTLRLVGLMD